MASDEVEVAEAGGLGVFNGIKEVFGFLNGNDSKVEAALELDMASADMDVGDDETALVKPKLSEETTVGAAEEELENGTSLMTLMLFQDPELSVY